MLGGGRFDGGWLENSKAAEGCRSPRREARYASGWNFGSGLGSARAVTQLVFTLFMYGLGFRLSEADVDYEPFRNWGCRQVLFNLQRGVAKLKLKGYARRSGLSMQVEAEFDGLYALDSWLPFGQARSHGALCRRGSDEQAFVGPWYIHNG